MSSGDSGSTWPVRRTRSSRGAWKLGILEGVDLIPLLSLSVLVGLSVLAAITASVLIYRAVANYFPPSIVRPYLWRELLRTRGTVLIAVGAAVAGAIAGAVITRAIS